jgi:hypothetical protein
MKKLLIIMIFLSGFVYAFDGTKDICFSERFAEDFVSLCYHNNEYLMSYSGFAGGTVKTGNKCECIEIKGMFSNHYQAKVYYKDK